MNLELYDKVRSVPQEAQKTSVGGRLKGMTDINPMWRIKTLTEQFGICGIGWKASIVKTWNDACPNGEIITSVEVNLFIKVAGSWSEPIQGIGGSKLYAKESNGFYADDEAFKKAYTDAISVACKALGFGADIYWNSDATKFTSNSAQGSNLPSNEKKPSKWAEVNEMIKNSPMTLASISEWILKKFGKPIRINELNDEQFDILKKAIMRAKEKNDE